MAISLLHLNIFKMNTEHVMNEALLFFCVFRISGCQITEDGCHYLVAALNVNPSHLRELDLSYNNPGLTGISLLSGGVKHKMCRLETLKYETEKNSV